MEYIPVYLIMIPIIISLLIYLLKNKYIKYLIFLGQGSISLLAVKYFEVNNGFIEDHVISLGGWDQTIGIALKNDSLSMAFIFLTIIIWWSILLYCFRIRGNDSTFMFLLLFLEGVYLGMLQTNDMFNLFVFIELITIVSTILILYKRDGESVRAGLYYLLFNSVGILFYLIGMMMIYYLMGTLNFGILTEKIQLIENTKFLTLSYIFIMAAVGVKSAFFPVFNWLPKAHSSAPSSISALLSGLLVKTGLYVFIRINQLYNVISLGNFFFVLGFFTAFLGVVFALSQKDIKQILAYHTISQVGIIMIGLNNIDKSMAIGGVLHIFNHGFFKSLLFLAAGVIVNTYKKRNVTKIRGVFKNMPFVSILMIIGMLSITGAPMFNGYVSKTLIKKGLESSYIARYSLKLINIGTVISFLKMSQIFFSKENEINFKEKYLSIREGMLIPATMCIVLGLFYVPVIKYIFNINLSPYINVFKFRNFTDYFVNIIVGVIAYKLVIKKDNFVMRRIRNVNISFGASNYLLIVYIFIMIIWKW